MAPIYLTACPFCSGPPQPFTKKTGSPATGPDDKGDEYEVEAHVFCHECGSQGETVREGGIETQAEIDAVTRRACERWNQRDARHADLFADSVAHERNRFPRKPE